VSYPADSRLGGQGTHRLVVIGGGCSGALVAAQLLLRAAAGVHVVLIERSSELGRGVAYGTLCPEHLLNVTAARMSAFPDDPGHFLRWAKRREGLHGIHRRVGPDDFLPRGVFGEYIQDVLGRARERAGPGVFFEHVTGEAVDIEDRRRGPGVVLSDGRTVEADGVVLAVGVLPGEYPIRRPLPFYRSPQYVHAPFKWDFLGDVTKGDALLLVGAGLSAVDIAVSCDRMGHKGVVHALSRRGIRPMEHLPRAGVHPQFLFPGQLPGTVRETLRLVRTEASKGGDWRAVVDSIRPVTQRLWLGYSLEERARFMRHLRPYWEAHRHRIAPATAATLRAMESAGRLRFHAGRLVSLRNTPTGATALLRQRGSEQYTQLSVAKVINCTGPRTDYSKFQHPLLINLLASGLIRHDPLALGIDALPSGEVLRFGGKPSGWLYTIGAPLKGVLWESTAVGDIRVQAAELAQRLISLSVQSHAARAI